MSKCFFLRILCIMFEMLSTVKLTIRINRTDKTAKTQIRPLEEKSDQGLHCLSLNLLLSHHTATKIQTVQF